MYATLVGLGVVFACGGASNPASVPAEPAQQSPLPSDLISTTLPTSMIIQTSEATQTVQPGGSPTAESPLEDQVARFSDAAWEFLVELTEAHSPRETATDEEADAAFFILDRFEQIGYDTGLQLFDFQLVDDDVVPLTVDMYEPPQLSGTPLSRSGEGVVTGTLVDVGLALPQDLSEDGLVGKVAFIQRGEDTFERKVIRVQNAGAVGAVIYNNLPGTFRGSMITGSNIPVVSVSQESGDLLAKLMESGEEVEVTVAVAIETFNSRNVIANKPGTDPGTGTVVLGAHFDTVPNVEGANDNGSGVSVLMTLAQEIFDSSFPFTIQIVAFGSEEVGLLGSRFYVTALSEEKQGDLIAMFNFDVPGSGNFIELQGDPEMSLRVRNYGDVNGIRVIRGNLDDGGSDHESFAPLHIPTLFFFANDISRIHTTGDTLDFINPKLLGSAVALGIFALDDLAARH